MPRKNFSSKPSTPRRYVPANDCDTKRRYGSEKEANEVKDHQELLTMGLELKVYRCTVPGCGGWHLTRNTQKMV